MALLTQTNEQYYAGSQIFTVPAASTQTNFNWTGGGNSGTNLIGTVAGVSNTNFEVYIDNVLQVEGPGATEYQLSTTVQNRVVLGTAATGGQVIKILLKNIREGQWNNKNTYAYIKLIDVINNFMVAYVGMDKLIPRCKRSDVVFHAKRGLQEFSYDTLKSIKSQELTIPPSLSVIIPQDYVNYVKMSWVDSLGVKHIIYPTTLTSNPYEVPVQDSAGVPTQNDLGENLEGASVTEERWKTANQNNLNGIYDSEMLNAGVYNYYWYDFNYGRRYGLDPETSQANGWFTINEREGKFSFSSNLNGQLIILEYISDGLSIDYDMRIPKMAEEAIYMHILYNILAGRANVPEYVVARYKKERRAALRNAKIRLSDIKLEEFTQVMRGKSKWIKH
jgi:hypothetical protein